MAGHQLARGKEERKDEGMDNDNPCDDWIFPGEMHSQWWNETGGQSALGKVIFWMTDYIQRGEFLKKARMKAK